MEEEEAEAAAEEEEAEAAGYRIKNKNPTQRCGEKNISSGKMNMVTRGRISLGNKKTFYKSWESCRSSPRAEIM